MTDPTFLSSRVEKAHERLDAMGERVSTLEKEGAVSAERMTTISTSLLKIETMIGRVAWLIIGAIIAAIMGFLIKGGFNG